jgi:phytanoyl-CoA hydroxylase
MLDERQIEQFDRDGFVAGSVVLTEDRVDELRDELDRVIAARRDPGAAQPVQITNLGGDRNSPVWQVVNIWQASPKFRDHLGDGVIVQEVAQLTRAHGLRVWHDQIQYKPPRHGGVNGWHQDAPLWPPLNPMTQVTAWVALDDVDASNGCMSMVAGSQRWGNQINYLRSLGSTEDLATSWAGESVDRRLCPVAKGAVHYHHCLTWHSSHANLSVRPRRAIAVHYMTDSTTYVAGGGAHVMRQQVDVRDGELLVGDSFPLVYSAGSSRPS